MIVIRICLIPIGLLVISIVLAGCGGSNNNQVMITNGQSDQLVVVSKAVLTDDEVAQLPSDFEEKAATEGWQRVSDGFERTIPASNVEVTNGSAVAVTDENGHFGFSSATSSSSSSSSIQIIVDGEVVVEVHNSTVVSTTRSSGARIWTLDVPESCCSDADSGAECTGAMAATSRTPMDEGRCLDYNGWWSDGQNYSKSDWRAFRNLVGSDCSKAVFQGVKCWLDHFRGGCWKVNGSGGCSAAIGHSSSYHKHNFPN